MEYQPSYLALNKLCNERTRQLLDVLNIISKTHPELIGKLLPEVQSFFNEASDYDCVIQPTTPPLAD